MGETIKPTKPKDPLILSERHMDSSNFLALLEHAHLHCCLHPEEYTMILTSCGRVQSARETTGFQALR